SRRLTPPARSPPHRGRTRGGARQKCGPMTDSCLTGRIDVYMRGPHTYLTAADVAEMLRVSEKSIYRWAARDPTMPALRIGGTVRFRAERLERGLRDREQGRGRAHVTDGPVPSARKPPPEQAGA